MSAYHKVIHAKTNEVLIERVQLCDTWLSRFKGLLGKSPTDNNTTVWLTPCNSIHTFGMNMPIDVVFISAEGLVLKTIKTLTPGKWVGPVPEACCVLEGTVGLIDRAQISEGTTLKLVGIK